MAIIKSVNDIPANYVMKAYYNLDEKDAKNIDDSANKLVGFMKSKEPRINFSFCDALYVLSKLGIFMVQRCE